MTIMNRAQLERLLSLLESLPPASIPLDAESAAALGTSTDPEEVFTTAVEAIFVNEEYDAIEALLEVVAHVTGTSPAPLLKAVTGKSSPEPEEEEEEETEEMYDVPEGEEDEAAPPDAVQPPKYGSPEWKKQHAKRVAEFRARIAHPEKEMWLTGDNIDRSGLNAFIHLVRGPDDPERAPRVKGADTLAWRKKLGGKDLEPWKKLMLDTLKREGPMTFNRLALLTSGYTADVVAQKAPDFALWELVWTGAIEHTNQSPIIFQVRKGKPLPPKPKTQTVETEDDEDEDEDEDEVEEKPVGSKHKFDQGEGDRTDWKTVGQSFDVSSPAEKKLSWEQHLESAHQEGKKWPLDVWGREIKTLQEYGASLYRPGATWPGRAPYKKVKPGSAEAVRIGKTLPSPAQLAKK